MTDERFNELLNGPLQHPLVWFTISRLALALRAVVEETGIAGAAALEKYCAARQDLDEAHAAHDTFVWEDGEEDNARRN